MTRAAHRLLAPLAALALAGSTAPLAPAAPAGVPATAPVRTTPTAAAGRPLAGVVVGVDAGHNGGWSPALNRLVDAGFGLRKPCNTSGTSTASGYAEHAHNWDVAQRLRARLVALGATVVMTRTSDTGVGPCIDVRSRTLARNHTTLNVSIHADGSYARGARGFHVIHGTRSVGGARVAGASRTLAVAMRTTFQLGTAMPRSTYIGGGTGLSPRHDLAFTNLATVPSVMVETGNMRNPVDAALLRSSGHRQREADAIANGIRAYLHR